jgi:hypothetical protein
MKKKTPKRAAKKTTRTRKPAAPGKRAASHGAAAPQDPIQAALARRRAAMLGR